MLPNDAFAEALAVLATGMFALLCGFSALMIVHLGRARRGGEG